MKEILESIQCWLHEMKINKSKLENIVFDVFSQEFGVRHVYGKLTFEDFGVNDFDVSIDILPIIEERVGSHTSIRFGDKIDGNMTLDQFVNVLYIEYSSQMYRPFSNIAARRKEISKSLKKSRK